MKSYVMISGATGGLGKAFAVECASRGWDVYLTDLRPEPLAVLSAALSNTYGVEARWCACDLTDTISQRGPVRRPPCRAGALLGLNQHRRHRS